MYYDISTRSFVDYSRKLYFLSCECQRLDSFFVREHAHALHGSLTMIRAAPECLGKSIIIDNNRRADRDTFGGEGTYRTSIINNDHPNGGNAVQVYSEHYTRALKMISHVDCFPLLASLETGIETTEGPFPGPGRKSNLQNRKRKYFGRNAYSNVRVRG